MTLLPTMPRPTVGPELVASIAILRERALAAGGLARKPVKPAGTPGLPPAVQAPARTPATVPILAAVLVVVVAAGGYLAYQRVTTSPVPSGLGAITSRSAAARPPWIASDAPGAAVCTEAGNRSLSCVGVSSVSAQRDDAEDEAADAAFDAVASALAVRITDATWKQAVPPIYAAARDAKLAAFDRDPASTSARREVRDARRAVAQALRATGGGAVPAVPAGRYWEEHQSPDGKRTLAFAQVTLGPAELARLSEGYVQPASALGATVVGLFPLIGWRYPRLERGAVIVGLAKGPLRELGLAERAVILGVGGRDVDDAAAFSALAGDEYAGLTEHGGTLRVKVAAETGAPREFAAAIKPARPDVAPPPASGKRRRGPRGSGSSNGSNGSNVNVWDKFSGSKPSGRDDPTQ